MSHIILKGVPLVVRNVTNKKLPCVTQIRTMSGAPKEHILYSPVPTVPDHPNDNFASYVLGNAATFKDKVALECSLTGKKSTFLQVVEQAGRWAGYLVKMGLQKGDVVAMVTPNVNEYSPVAFGNGSIGCVTTTLNPTSTPEEIAFQLQDSKAKLVVVFSPFEPVVRQALSIIKKDIPLVGVGVPSPSGLPQASDIFNDKDIPFTEPQNVGPSHPFSLMYSSGTTGRPKGAIISHGAACAQHAMVMDPTFYPDGIDNSGDSQRTFLMILPMFHVAGLHGVHPLGLSKGFRQVNYPKFDPANYLQMLMKYQVSELHVAPALLNFLVSHPAVTKEVLQHVQTVLCGTAPMPPSAKEAFVRKVDRDIIFQQVYGMTELLASSIDPWAEQKAGYAGKLLPGVTAKVVDLEDGQSVLPPNTDGEVLIKSPCVMTEYLNNPEATSSTLDADGYLHTGDVGQYDEDGFIKFIDRTKDLIKVKGFQVSPSELEDVISSLPEVVEAGVVGVEHQRLGEAPFAFVVTKEKITADKINSFVGSKLSKHKQLVGGIVFLEALPRNTNGKILKKTLREMANKEIAA